jgi:hypothetical protein
MQLIFYGFYKIKVAKSPVILFFFIIFFTKSFDTTLDNEIA